MEKNQINESVCNIIYSFITPTYLQKSMHCKLLKGLKSSENVRYRGGGEKCPDRGRSAVQSWLTAVVNSRASCNVSHAGPPDWITDRRRRHGPASHAAAPLLLICQLTSQSSSRVCTRLRYTRSPTPYVLWFLSDIHRKRWYWWFTANVIATVSLYDSRTGQKFTQHMA